MTKGFCGWRLGGVEIANPLAGLVCSSCKPKYTCCTLAEVLVSVMLKYLPGSLRYSNTCGGNTSCAGDTVTMTSCATAMSELRSVVIRRAIDRSVFICIYFYMVYVRGDIGGAFIGCLNLYFSSYSCS